MDPHTTQIVIDAIDPERDYRIECNGDVFHFTGEQLLASSDNTLKLFRALRNGNDRRAHKIIRRMLRGL